MPARGGRSVRAMRAGNGGESGSDIGVLNLADPACMQRTKIGAGEVELGDLVGGRPQFVLFGREIDINHLAEGPFGCGSPRGLLVLRVVSERDTGEDLACAIACLRRREPFGATERDASGVAVGAVLRNIGAPAPLQPQPEACELGVPYERFTLPGLQHEARYGLGIELQLHGSPDFRKHIGSSGSRLLRLLRNWLTRKR